MQILWDDLLQFESIIKIDGAVSEEFSGIEFDTRRDCSEKLFFAFQGKNSHGHDFIDEAIEKGAKACVSEDMDAITGFSDRIMTIHVKDCLGLLKEMASFYLSKNKIKVIAVTGSSGKTTTKEMIFEIFRDFFKVSKTSGNFNNMLGICHSVLNSCDDIKFFIAECGMNHPGELTEISDMLKPVISLIVNVGYVHGGNFLNVEEIAKAKLEISSGMKNRKFLIYNRDCTELAKLAGKIKGAFCFGNSDSDMDYEVSGYNGEYSDIVLKYGGRIYNTRKRLYPFQVENYAGALCVMIKTGIPIETVIEKDLSVFSSMRMERKNISGFDVFLDCYNSNPYSLEKILPQLNLISKKWIVVLGDMKELGNESLFWHQHTGKIFADNVKGKLICHGEMSHMIGEGALKSGRTLEDVVFSDNFSDTARLVKYFGKDYSVFIKGSRSMNMEKIADLIGE